MNRRIGIMQGRLVPPEKEGIQHFPRKGWRDEFPAAAVAGLAAIEWIDDEHGVGGNPIESDDGIADMQARSANHGVAVRSICADWFMEHPLLRAGAELDKRLGRFRWLLERAARLGATRVVIPFVDHAAIRSGRDADQAVAAIEALLPAAERTGVELHLETALGPAEFLALLDRIPHPLVRANYDSGNSAALGYDVREEFQAYGSRIGSVHIKDRVRGGGTVPLGEGDADLAALFECLDEKGYDGDLVLQVARGRPGDEVAWAQHNRRIVERLQAGEAAWISD